MERGVNATRTETLTLLAQTMESLRPAGAEPAWVEIIGPVEAPEGIRWHLDPVTMVGFVAPPDCHAICTVGYGWVRALADASGAVENPPALLQGAERRRGRVVFLMTRTGDMAGYLRDGPTVLIDEPPTVGRIPDCIRRSFGLPTPPPDESTSGLLASIWLSNVLGAAGRTGRPLPWATVALRHPVIECATAAGIDIPPSQFRRILEVGAEAWTWSHLVEQAKSGGGIVDLLPAGAGGWMDEGILSRWLLDAVTRVDRLVDRVIPVVEPAAAKKLRATLSQLGLRAGSASATTSRARRTTSQR